MQNFCKRSFWMSAAKLDRLRRPGTDVMIFLNIFTENFCEKIVVFDSKQS
jgi:hypothetical protein